MIDPSGRVEKSVAVVTGAGQGLGEGIAAALGSAGYAVAILDIDGAAAASAVRTLAGRGIPAIGMPCDVASRGDVDRALGNVLSVLGRLDVLVNNAQTTRIGPILDLRRADVDMVWQSGVLGTLHMMQSAYPSLVETHGSVVNVASGAGLSAPAGYGIYAATKEAIRTLTRVAALEWGPAGIRVNVISPSARTSAFERWAEEHPEALAKRMSGIPLGRIGDAELDVGAAVVFLAGPESRYITGSTLVVDGGAHYLR